MAVKNQTTMLNHFFEDRYNLNYNRSNELKIISIVCFPSFYTFCYHIITQLKVYLHPTNF